MFVNVYTYMSEIMFKIYFTFRCEIRMKYKINQLNKMTTISI